MKRIDKILLFVLFFAAIGLIPGGFSFAYNEPTHIDLTKKIVEIYNKYNDPKITAEQLNWMVDGSAKEDTAPRWINHFYDPIYKIGWTGLKEGDVPQETVSALSKILLSASDAVSSLNWLHNETLQEKYGFYEGNQTYNRALSAFAYSTDLKSGVITGAPDYANFQTAFKALGHTLHLLEDLGVPAHTRNDTHANAVTVNDADPYETWTVQPGNDDLNGLSNLTAGDLNFNCQTIDGCLINLATYTNKNFYSKDTIDDQKYKNIEADKVEEVSGNLLLFFKKDILNNLYLFKIFNNETKKSTIDDSQIHQAYWNLLSKQIVLAGVKALKVFYSDAAKEEENIQFPTHAISFNKCTIPIICTDSVVSPYGEFAKISEAVSSFAGNVANTTKNVLASAGSFITSIFSGTGNNLNQIGQVDLNQYVANNSQSQTNVSDATASGGSVQSNNAPKSQTEVQTLKSQVTDLKKEVSSLNKELNNQSKVSVRADATSTMVKDSAAKTVPIAAADFCKFSTTQTPKHTGVILNEIAWMGAIKSSADEWMELKNISNAEVDLTNWQLISEDGGIKINFSDLKNKKIGSGAYALLERTDDNTVLGISADLIYKGALSDTNEKLRLFDSGCNLIDEVVADPNWPAGDAALKKTMERNADGAFASLADQFGWYTSVSGNGTPKALNFRQQVVYSGGGGSGVISNNPSISLGNNIVQQAEAAQFYEITINEIMYNPDGDDTGREWIEIFNKSSSTVDLSGFKLSESGTNHGLTLKQGDKNLTPSNYAIISNSAVKFLADYPNYPGIIFESPFSLNNSNENVILKNVDLKIDEINYASSTGAYDNGNSLQLINGAWRESIPTPGELNNLADNAANQNATSSESIMARFSFSPLEPKENEQVIFDAASSTSGSGNISIYEWNFGDGDFVTSTNSTVIHLFKTAGTYITQLAVYGNNTSSTISSAVSVLPQTQSQGINHIVISEIMAGAGAGKADEEFIELYNPTGSQIDLTGYYLKRKISLGTTSTQPLASADDFAGKIIAPKGFLLVASPEYQKYQSDKKADIAYSHPYHLAYDNDVVILYNSDGVVDEVAYSDINDGQSLERKAFKDNICISPQDRDNVSGEFLGNGCDTGDIGNDFEIRTEPNPQNSESLPEPRNAPAQVQNFNVNYDFNSTSLVFNWNQSADYNGSADVLSYKIIDISDVASSSLLQTIQATSTSVMEGIDEVGRINEGNYKLSIQAFDADGLGSTPSIKSVDVPSFVSNIYFYKNSNNQNNYIEGYYGNYPFIPDKFSSGWKVVIFYLNQDAPKTSSFDEAAFWGGNAMGALKLIYKTCSGYDIAINNAALILPDSAYNCDVNYGGVRNSAFLFSDIEDRHFIAKLDPANQALKDGDYATAAFYDYSGNNVQSLVAVDKIHYQFKNLQSGSPIEWQQAPKFPEQSQVSLNFDKAESKLNISWPKAVDDDSVDSKINYEIQYAENGEWQSIGNATGTSKIVSAGDNFSIKIKSQDDFGNFDQAQILSAAWSYPAATFYITQANAGGWSNNFGTKNVNYPDAGDVASLQSIVPDSDFQFNKVVLRVWQANNPDYSYNADLRIKVFADNNGTPSENSLGESIIHNLVNPDKNSDITFSFNSPVSLMSGKKYWLMLDVSGYGDNRGYDANYWVNAIDTGDYYPSGASGNCFGQGCFGAAESSNSYFNVPAPSGADWYMKIGME